LDGVLGPVSVRRVEGEVIDIDLSRQGVTVNMVDRQQDLFYDRLVFALAASSSGRKSPIWLASDVDTVYIMFPLHWAPGILTKMDF
jgi:hypothetical protein